MAIKPAGLRFFNHTLVHVLLLVAVLFVLGWLSLSPLLFYSSDTGLRFIQIRELIAHDWHTLTIDYPAATLDPSFSYVPFYFAYGLIENQLYLTISPFFPLLASVLYAGAGRAGIVLAPLLGTVLTALAVFSLAQFSQLPRPRIALWATILTTPLLFYSLTLWDHTLAVACTTWAVVALVAGSRGEKFWLLLLGGALLSLSFAQRVEVALFGVAAGVALLIATWPRIGPLIWAAIGALLAAIPVAALQVVLVGHPLGIVFAAHLFGYGVPEAFAYTPFAGAEVITPAIKATRFLLHVVPGDAATLIAALLVLVGGGLLILAIRNPRYGQRPLPQAGTGAMAAGYLIWLAIAPGGALTGVLATFPLFPLSFSYLDRAEDTGHDRRTYQFVFLTAVLFLATMVLIWPAYGGLQWGSRYLLPVYPLLLYLALYRLDTLCQQSVGALSDRDCQDRRSDLTRSTAEAGTTSRLPDYKRPALPALRAMVAILILLSVVVQLAGVAHLFHTKREQAALKQELLTVQADVILTNMPFLPSWMAGVEGRTFFYVDERTDLDTLIPRFVENGVDQFGVAFVDGLPPVIPDQAGGVPLAKIGPGLYAMNPAGSKLGGE